MKKLKEIELLRRQRDIRSSRRDRGRRLGKALVLLLTAAVMLGLWRFSAVRSANAAREVVSLSDAIASDALTRDVARAGELELWLSQLSKAQQQLTQQREAMASYPTVSSAVLERLSQCGGEQVSLQLTSYNADTGLLKFEAVTGAVLDIPAYVVCLTDTGLFEQVNYSGYDFDSKAQVYAIRVECYLRADAGKAAAR